LQSPLEAAEAKGDRLLALYPRERGQMKIGIFYEHQLPRPWEDDAEYRLLQNALEEAELADRLGIEYFWEVEHHFLEEYSHSSAPEVFLGAVSQRTRNIRLGHGIVLMPPPFNHPARVAERIATLDLVSSGRVEFGTGESSSEAELGGFLIDPAQKRAMWEEGVKVALRCMTETPFTGFSGKYVTLPPRNVVPKPLQKPHPPVWVACSRRDTILMAARKGIGALSFAFVDAAEARKWVDDYYRILETDATPIGDAVNANIACVTTFMCCPTEEEALAKGLEGANFFGYSLAHYYIFGEHRPGKTNVWEEFLERRAQAGYSPEAVRAAAEHSDRLGAKIVKEGREGLRGAIGTPEQVREYLRTYEEAGVDQLILVSQAGKNRHEDIMESLELFGEKVLPEFKERDEKYQEQKKKKLEPIIEKALARKPEDDHPPLPKEDYSFPAIPRAMLERSGSDAFFEFLEKIAERTATGRIRDASDLGIP
jgi:alkanesulfonate monooxygenase SsuD/methylene tetrahydromethanopterin reductase-like flavin-dependent oxidoreductase (luciferase family)